MRCFLSFQLVFQPCTAMFGLFSMSSGVLGRAPPPQEKFANRYYGGWTNARAMFYGGCDASGTMESLKGSMLHMWSQYRSDGASGKPFGPWEGEVGCQSTKANHKWRVSSFLVLSNYRIGHPDNGQRVHFLRRLAMLHHCKI